MSLSWIFRPDKWPRTPEQWLDAASSFPVTPSQWLRAADDLRRSPTRMFLDVVRSLGDTLSGRELEIRSGDSDVTLVFEGVRAAHEPRPLGPVRARLDVEVIDELDIDTRDVRWDEGRIDRLRIAVRNLRLEPGAVADAVARPVDLTAEIEQETLDWWLERTGADVEVELDAVGTASARPQRWRKWVRATVRPELVGDELHVHVERAWVGRFGFAKLPRVPSVHVIPLPEFDRDLHVTSIDVRPGLVRVHGRIPEWREPLYLDQVMRAAGTVGSHVVFNRSASAT